MKRIILGLAVLVALPLSPGTATANEFTDVIDAFDDDIDDPFDISIRVGYLRTQRSSLIRRENFEAGGAAPHPWDYFKYINMFEYTQVTHVLNMELEIGIFKDLALKGRIPLILNDTRELKAKQAMHWADLDGDGVSNGVGDTLFALPFKSPERSGLDHFAIGLWWGILDQSRDDTKPNWTVFIEGRFTVGDKLEAGCASTGRSDCDFLNYNDGTPYNTKGGISRGINELAFGTRLSRRYGLFDPYFGIEALIGWPQEGTAFKVSEGAAGQINDMPPVVGTLDFGLELVPWDVPEAHRKFAIGLGSGGKYFSEGREYTPLFDALGTSPVFHDETYVDFNGNGQNDGGQETAAVDEWSGMTDVENYALFQGTLYFMIQPAKYVKFKLGTQLAHETEHFITKTDQCPAGQLLSNGECGVYNFGHRPQIDRPGLRFRAEETLIWNFFINATAQF